MKYAYLFLTRNVNKFQINIHKGLLNLYLEPYSAQLVVKLQSKIQTSVLGLGVEQENQEEPSPKSTRWK